MYFRIPDLGAAAMVALFCLLSPWSLSAADVDDRTLAYRREFLAAIAALPADPDAFESRRRDLDAYVLAPYLDYARLRRKPAAVDRKTAQRFIGQAPPPLGEQFRREYLLELAKRPDWPGFLSIDKAKPARGTELRCQRIRALLATNRDSEARSEFLEVWATGASLPQVCDGPINQARDRGWLDSDLIWQRLRLAVAANNPGLAGYLARLLPEGERKQAERLVLAVKEPETSLKAATKWSDKPANREVVVQAMKRRARADVASAIGHWLVLAPRFSFDAGEHAAITHDVALYAAVAYRPDAEDWFEQVPEPARSEQLGEWQLRAALAAEDWGTVLKVIAGLPAPLPEASRNRYWRARALAETGQPEESRAVYEALAGEANFHGFLAADRLSLPYAICPKEVAVDAARAADLRGQVDLSRALELHAVGWRVEAARAWDYALESASDDERMQILALASAQGWHDRVVFALNSGDNLRYYSLRFPVAERETVEREAALNGIDPAWAYALIRAESAWQPDARSPADAYGLMQLLPATGQRMARQLGLGWRGTAMLLDPRTNIRLGTRYLAQQADRFDGSPWLATAAYNAGPTPVMRWVAERSSLPADIFIETIPYRETREYVVRVLAFSVIYDWRLNGRTRPMSGRLPDPDKRYAGPAGSDTARVVVCSAAEAPGAG